MKSDSSEDFEDAVDTLPPLLSSMQRPNDLNSSTPRTSVPSNSMTPYSRIEMNPHSTRRNRLANLRNKMQTEFGGSNNLAGMDEDASQSDRTSLASWGRNLLMERSNDSSVIAVCPADSLSTKAMPILPNSSFFDRSIGFDTPNKNNKTSTTLTSSLIQDQTLGPTTFSPSSPPPVMPPPPAPPIPERPSNFNTPPPLPPRKHVNSPPSVSAQDTSLTNVTTDSFNSFSMNKSDLNSSTNEKSKISLSKSNNNNITSSIADSKKLSENATSPNTVEFGKKRGHAKTNSLDRGLTLAKTIKSGPFPPPQSTGKSNSLNRGYSPSDMLAMGSVICEEDKEAHSVIEQITDSILSNCDTDDEPSLNHEEIHKEKIYPSRTINSDLVAVCEESSTTSTPTKAPPQIPAEPIVKLSPLDIKNRRYENLHPLDKDIEEPTTSQIDSSTSGPQISSERKELSLSDSIDPITRDVARRMSMKECKTQTEENEEDAEGQPSIQTGLEHAKSVVKSYGAMAGGFFKGAFTKAKKTIVIGQPNPPKALSAKDEDDDIASVSDEGTASVSESVQQSVNHQPTTSKPIEPEIICRPKNAKKGPYDFDQLRVVQELNNEHSGAVWVMKFSVCGRLLATAGQDNIVRVWVLKNHLNHFAKVRERLNQQTNRNPNNSNSSNLQDGFQFDMQDIENAMKNAEDKKSPSETTSITSSRKSPDSGNYQQNASTNQILFAPKPFCTYRGHTADVLDLSWSRNYFVLSCGMDRTVRLWHLARSECLCCFQHMDFVTCISFMPKDDRYFISGCMDGKIRLWHIPEKKVALWNEVEQVKFITAITFVRNGKFVVVGTYNGRCFVYTTDQLKYHTVIDVRSSRGKNARGHKITSLAVHGDKLLVTSNDSRIRIYDLRDMNLTCKFKGAQIEQSQIRASFSPDGKHILCGSEDHHFYIWRTQDFSPSLSVRKDRNPMWERAKVHNSVVTAAIFAPKPHLILSLIEDNQKVSPTNTIAVSHNQELLSNRALKRMDSDVISSQGALPIHIPSIVDNVNVGGTSSISSSTTNLQQKDRHLQGDIIVSADLNGCIKVLANPSRIKAGSSHFFCD